MLEKFEVNKISVNYGNIIKLMSSHPELINNLCRVEIFKSLSNYIINSVFDISSEAMSAIEEILFSENKTVEIMVGVFLGKKCKEMMEIFMFLFEEDNYLAKREGLRIIFTLLENKEQNKDFYNYFLSQKSHLKFTMTFLNDESTPIQVEAFRLLMVFLNAPEEARGSKVNDTLRRNSHKMIEFLKEFLEDKEKDDDTIEENKKIAIKALKKMKKKTE